MNVRVLLKSALAVLACAGAVSAHAALQARDFDSDGAADAYYDTELNLTWLADFNYAKTSGYDDDGGLNLEEARSWAADLSYFGTTDWRLPGITPLNGVSYDYTKTDDGSSDYGTANTGVGWGQASELGHLFYVTLGNSAWHHPDYNNPTAFVALSNSGPFSNLETGTTYWLGPDFGMAGFEGWGWDFDMWDGSQDEGNPSNRIRAVAVHDGDIAAVAAVPEPSTYAMMSIGLLMLVTMRRRLHRN